MEKALNNCLASAACFCDFSEHSAAEFALKSLPYPMSEIQYRGRRAHALRNDQLEVVVTVEGGHIAGIIDLATKINPLWSPPWPSIEPSQYDLAKHPQYGNDAESKLLAGILGHNLCLDLFGGPSQTEAAAGMTVHGEASIAPNAITTKGDSLTQ